MYEAIGRPLELGSLRLKNRIVFAPTTLGLAEPQQEQLLRRIAAGGSALAWVGDVPVGRKGFGSLFSKKGFEHYRRLTGALHSEGCLAGAQLHQSDSDLGAMVKYLPALLTRRINPDELRQKLSDAAGPYITGLPAEKVKRITAAFGDAAAQACRAGFDLVQVHGDRMCGSFASSLFNRRTDAYGGSLENRLRFAREAVEAVRASRPDLPIDFKLVVRLENYGRAGLLPDELAVAVLMLEAAGVTSFHVTLANHSALTDTIPPGEPPGLWGGRLLFVPVRHGAAVHPPAGVRRGRADRPGLRGAAAGRRPHRLRRHEPSAHRRPRLAQQGARRPCRRGAPLRAVQQGLPGRPDGAQGRSLHF